MNTLLLSLALLGQCCQNGNCGPQVTPSLSLVMPAKEQGPTAMERYTDARNACLKDGRPLLVLLCSQSCPYCREAEKLLPQLRCIGRVVQLAAETDTALAGLTTEAGPVPRLAVFRREVQGWSRQTLVGAEQIREFVFPAEVSGGDAPRPFVQPVQQAACPPGRS